MAEKDLDARLYIRDRFIGSIQQFLSQSYDQADLDEFRPYSGLGGANDWMYREESCSSDGEERAILTPNHFLSPKLFAFH